MSISTNWLENFGVGRIDMVENRVVGLKSREIYEAPAATLLHMAHTELERICLDRNTFNYKRKVSQDFANLVYDGVWFGPLRECLQAFVEESQRSVTGEVRIRVSAGLAHHRAEIALFSLQSFLGHLPRGRHLRSRYGEWLHGALWYAVQNRGRGAAESRPARVQKAHPERTGIEQMALWDGRFGGGPAEEMQRFSESIGVDLRMFNEDIDGSKAHATMLGAVGLISKAEADALCEGLEAVREDISSGTWTPSIALEDVHMAVETRLGEHVGDLAGKLHTARSRNDQVATDVRLWLKKHLSTLDLELQRLIEVLLDRIEQDGAILIPGFTHLQRGQPIWLGHQLLAHTWALARDRERLADALKRVDVSPLGAGAMAGTPHPIDRRLTADLMGFSGVVENAMDAVAARDHAQEVAALCAICMTHLSRMAAEIVLFSSREFGLIRLGEGYATGSSIMPQKRNPDGAELIRGKTGRVYGDLQALLAMVKGLPMAYNRDLQEDREALFDAVDTCRACVSVMAGMWKGLSVTRGRYEEALKGDFLLATELADYLALKGVPFREAHHVVGRLVKDCEEAGTDFSSLTVEI